MRRGISWPWRRTTQRLPPPYSVNSSRWPSWKSCPIRSETRVMGTPWHATGPTSGPVRDAVPANLRALVPPVGENRAVERDTSASVRPALVPCLVLLAYLAGAAALLVGRHTGATAAWFPAVGVGVIALLVAPRPRWPLTLAALTAAFALANFTAGRDVGVSLVLGLADSVEVALVGWLVMRFLTGRLRD